MPDLPIGSSAEIRCVFTTVFWGDWHRGMFLRANLPTMLAARNLPALAAGLTCEYLIYTTAKDATELQRDPAFTRLQSLLPVTLKLFTPSRTKHPITLHHDIWRQATKHAQRLGAFVLLMPPDVAWADGSFARLRIALEAGKRVMFMAYPRVVSETIVPAMLKQFPRADDQSSSISGLELMTLAMTHIHPLMAAYNRFSAHFPVHPEMILWPVDGGFLLRLLARELFCFQPGRYPLNAQSLLKALPPPGEIEVFDDSREFLGVSLTPLWKDMEWYLKRRQIDPLFVGRWWITYESPVNDHLSSLDLRFDTKMDGDEGSWRRAAQQARNTLIHLRSAREFIRVLLLLRQIGHLRAAAFLASTLRVHGLARRWVHRGPFVVFAPDDDAFESVGFDRAPGDGMSVGEARAVLEAHIAIRPPASSPNKLDVRTLAGETLRIEDLQSALRCGDNLVVPMRHVMLPRLAAKQAQDEPAGMRSVTHLPA